MSHTREPPHPRGMLLQKKDHLPHDVVLNILVRLLVKSVLRFRCVSKTWDSSITTPSFISTHLNLNLNNNNNNNSIAYLITPTIALGFPFIITIPSFIGSYDHAFNRISKYPIPSAFPRIHLASSCNGLVCLYPFARASINADSIYLWNPSIRKFKRLPAFLITQSIYVSTGFAYQPETNDYKVVKISQMYSPEFLCFELEAEVYTLSSNSWKKVGISLTNKVAIFHFGDQTAKFVSGALHWLGYVGARHYVILSFDVSNDKFEEIALPDGKLAFVTLDHLRFDHVNEGEYNDFMRSRTPHSCFIWVMGEYGVHESWTKLFFVRFENVVSVSFFGCTSHGELLVLKRVIPMSNDERRYYVTVSLDLETLHEKDLGFQDAPHIATTFMESLVLLDGANELSG
nr:F-box/kelch-repeat protein At3g06240-like [Quercus suber]